MKISTKTLDIREVNRCCPEILSQVNTSSSDKQTFNQIQN